MKLEKILSLLNSFEKNSFLKIIDQLIANNPKNIKDIDKILSESNKDLKSIDNINISKVFSLLESEFSEFVKSEFVNTSSQLDILIDIIYKDGNAIIKQDWFSRLYELKINEINRKIKSFRKNLEGEQSDVSVDRIRDYKIYLHCLKTAYYNDEANNQEKKITTDEQSILIALANSLGLSHEETKLINYLILPVKKHEIDSVINELKSIGVIFFSRKNSTIYVADEVVHILRKVRGKEISDKYFTWGYKYRKKDIPSNVQQAIAKLNYYKNYKKNFFTFILGPNIENDFQRYVYQNVDYDKLYENRLAFIKNFNNSKNLIFKKYFVKRYSNQDSQSTIKKKLNITNNNITNNFQIIFQSKVLIFDYFSTMFFEVINLDIPFIFILDEKNFFFSKIGYDLLNFLKKNNLLFKSGKEAAIFLNKINDIEVWWQTSIDKNKLNQIKTTVSNVKFKNLQFWLEQFKN